MTGSPVQSAATPTGVRTTTRRHPPRRASGFKKLRASGFKKLRASGCKTIRASGFKTIRAGSFKTVRFRGFTLVELLVAIGILVLLVGVTLAASNALTARAETQQTADTIRLLDLAVREWELETDRKLTWGVDDPLVHYDVSQTRAQRAPVLVITEVLGRVSRTPAVRQVIARIDPERLVTYGDPDELPRWIDGSYWAGIYLDQLREELPETPITVLDAWGKPLYATHPGAVLPAGDPTADRDGTERTWNEDQWSAVAQSRQICFISAGPDGRFGLEIEYLMLLGEDRERAMKLARRDNIYSYPPGNP